MTMEDELTLLANLLSLPKNQTKAEEMVSKACRLAAEELRQGYDAPTTCKKLSNTGWMMVIHRVCSGEGMSHAPAGDSRSALVSAEGSQSSS